MQNSMERWRNKRRPLNDVITLWEHASYSFYHRLEPVPATDESPITLRFDEGTGG